MNYSRSQAITAVPESQLFAGDVPRRNSAQGCQREGAS